MSHFNFKIEQYKDTTTTSLTLYEADENDLNNHSYDLYFQSELNLDKDKQSWVGVQLTHWINTAGKNSTFKQVCSMFDKFCKQAEKLKA